ncbi:MAG: phage baseplate protein [Chloroflexi bacterium]|nr:phage baseplate protein [Chloroflexota bacterium]
MHTLIADDLLTIWEQGVGQPLWQRALLILQIAFPEFSQTQLAEAPIGQRDGLLLAVREQLFGSNLEAVVDCPQCKRPLDLQFSTTDIRVNAEQDLALPLITAIDDFELQFRLPNSIDLASLAANSPQTHKAQLLNRCLLDITRNGEHFQLDDLPNSVITHLLQIMSTHDPQAEVLLNLTCPDCEYQWAAIFDILTFLWREVQTGALKLLREVHLLASAYGWHEADILQMSAWRRQFYLRMVQG